MTSRRKLALLSSLYFSQGLPYGFFVQALPVLLREAGVSLEVIGLTSLLALPWAFKFLWAPLVDRFDGSGLGRRRGWILPLQGIAVATLAGMGFIDPGSGL
ncbi:MAG: MFS transporter, partial [Candidatus Riflebacteria bacterium]|nr:MFS transporter [Candidatus Riflebacteria bacterium]